ncbi:hypothetical protein VTI28DRAFT_2385 [Corynascus sepedonium]
MDGVPPLFEIHPPLINSACPWATTIEDLRDLYKCPSTGAVTTRTSLIAGFDHDPARHQYAFFDSDLTSPVQNASLNSLGYSPLTLETYLGFIRTISADLPARSSKGFIVSITGTPEDIAASYKLIASTAQDVRFPLAMEINLSCPNIPNRPPPAYSEQELSIYLTYLRQAITQVSNRIPVGLKTPPYTYATQYQSLISALEAAVPYDDSDHDGNERGACPISFITATNTLGSCLLLSPPSTSSPDSHPASPLLPGSGLGGMAGAPLHPLSLGNVYTIRRMLDETGDKKLGRHVRVVGVGGVSDAAGYKRMRAAGADVVGLATALGLRGLGVFRDIEGGLGEEEGGSSGW